MLITKVFLDDYRPKFKDPIPECYQELITSYWVKNPEERPTFDQIIEQLKNNEDFITESVDKDEYLNYIDFIENSDMFFDPSKKFKKITFSKEQLNNDQVQKKSKKHKNIKNDFKIDKIPGINIFHHSDFEINKIIGKGKKWN